jgi:hypothetical protein
LQPPNNQPGNDRATESQRSQHTGSFFGSENDTLPAFVGRPSLFRRGATSMTLSRCSCWSPNNSCANNSCFDNSCSRVGARSIAITAPWILYKLLVQDSVHKQMQVANSVDVASAMALIRAGVAAHHTVASGTEHRAIRLDSANRPCALNKLIGSIANASKSSTKTSNHQRSQAPLRPSRQLDSVEEQARKRETEKANPVAEQQLSSHL